MSLSAVESEIQALADPDKARQALRFFKTGPGEYGEGDRFRGLRMPEIRQLCREYRELAFDDVLTLLSSSWHEERMLALLIWVEQYKRGGEEQRVRIFEAYLANSPRINNWDLVDVTSPHIVGRHLLARDRAVLYRLAASDLIWDRRIAVLATFCFIRSGEFKDTLGLAENLLADPEDLMHKAVGWMLREVGNRDRECLTRFLNTHRHQMPRTMLRYAIEKYPAADRKLFLA